MFLVLKTLLESAFKILQTKQCKCKQSIKQVEIVNTKPQRLLQEAGG